MTGWITPRRLLGVCLLALTSMQLSAQPARQDDDTHYAMYGGPLFRLTRVAGESALMLGGRPALLIDDCWGLALTVMGWGNSDIRGRDGLVYDLQVGYAGATFEWLSRTDRIAHVVGELTTGLGRVTQSPPGAATNNEKFLVLEPGVTVEAKVSRSFRVAAGMTYRFASGVNSAAFSDADLSAAALILNFKFGRFHQRNGSL